MRKSVVWIGAIAGGIIGGFIPALWGDSSFLSPWSIIFSTIGGVAGIVAVYKLYKSV
jgi:outer membrane lipoprotein SlyB